MHSRTGISPVQLYGFRVNPSASKVLVLLLVSFVLAVAAVCITPFLSDREDQASYAWAATADDLAYSYDISFINEPYNGNCAVYVKTDNPMDGVINNFTLEFEKADGSYVGVIPQTISNSYADVRGETTSGGYFKRVDGGYLGAFNIQSSGLLTVLVKEDAKHSNGRITRTWAPVGTIYVKDFQESKKAWFQSLVDLCTTPSMTKAQKMDEICAYLKTRGRYLKTYGSEPNYLYLIADYGVPYFVSYEWDSYISPYMLAELGDFLNYPMQNLYTAYPMGSTNWTIYHYYVRSIEDGKYYECLRDLFSNNYSWIKSPSDVPAFDFVNYKGYWHVTPLSSGSNPGNTGSSGSSGSTSGSTGSSGGSGTTGSGSQTNAPYLSNAYLYSDGTLIIQAGTAQVSGHGSLSQSFLSVGSSSSNYAPWKSYSSSIKKVIINEPIAPSAINGWFAGLAKLEAVEGLENLLTSNCTSFADLFSGCSSLRSVDLSRLDSSNVTSLAGMFNGCTSLTSLNLTGLNTAKVQDWDGLAYGCSRLTQVDLSGLNGTSAKSMRSAFAECTNLQNVNFGSTKFSNLTDMAYLFYDCRNLTQADLSGFTTNAVTTMAQLFSGCSSLRTVNVGTLTAPKLKDASGMFIGCSNLQSIDLSNFNNPTSANLSTMFGDCVSLATINIPKIATGASTNMMEMFRNANDVTKLTVGSSFTFKSEAIAGWKGNATWTNATTGATYATAQLPSNVAATYVTEGVSSSGGTGSSGSTGNPNQGSTSNGDLALDVATIAFTWANGSYVPSSQTVTISHPGSYINVIPVSEVEAMPVSQSDDVDVWTFTPREWFTEVSEPTTITITVKGTRFGTQEALDPVTIQVVFMPSSKSDLAGSEGAGSWNQGSSSGPSGDNETPSLPGGAGDTNRRGWIQVGNQWFYQNSDGSYAKSWLSLNGTWYYFDSYGVMQTGWQKIGSVWYYLGSSDDGAMKTGWQKIGSAWYYLGSDGAMRTGWYQVGGQWYYSDGSGAMVSNRWIGNYYLGSSGAMATNTWIGRYHVNSSGLWDATR